jgi:hypothetical protein
LTTKTFRLYITILTVLSCLISEAYMKKDIKTNFNRATTKYTWGNNNIYFLVLHDINCNANEALQGFKLDRPSSTEIAYKYACKVGSSLISGKTYDKQTPPNDVASNRERSANYLDRHNVKCKNGYALQRFKLNRAGYKISYSYRCVQVSCDSEKTFTTNETSNGGYETIYLDRQDIRLKTDQVMVGFRLISERGQFYYSITYCTLKQSAVPAIVSNPIIPAVVKKVSNQIKGKMFCSTNCQANPLEKMKKCKLGGKENLCKRCTIKSSIRDAGKKLICESLCDSISNQPCDFYGYQNNSKKNVDSSLLLKYGLIISKR